MEARLFGWFHPSMVATLRSCAVLLCQPLGHEYMYSYRAFRHLAERLSQLGFPVLRFDYLGTGNSAGPSYGERSVSEWQESIPMALAELRERSGQSRVSLVGLRLGATLGTLAALEDERIDSLVLWEPCVTGKSYVRQVKVLAANSGELQGRPTVDQETGYVEALGFALTPEMVAQLSSIDLLQIQSPPASRALLLTRANSAPQDAFAQRLTTLGTTVTRAVATDYDTFMVTVEKSVLPTATQRTVTDWLETTYPGHHPPRQSPIARTAVRTTEIGTPPIREELVGIQGRLFGVVTDPADQDPDRPAVIFLTMGADHHVGPRRLYVHLARTLASRGFVALRFDLSGIGDTPPAPGGEENVPYPSTAQDDIRDVIEYLRLSRGIQSVVLAGMCAGGAHAVYGAGAHRSVCGIIAINAPLYMGPGVPLDADPFEQINGLSRIGRALRSPDAWARLLNGQIPVHHAWRLVAQRGQVPVTRNRIVPRRMRVGQEHSSNPHILDELFLPDVDTHLIFGSNDLGLRYLRHIGGTRLDDILRARENFQLSVVEGAGHVFIPLQGQARLTDLITTWLNRYVSSASKT